MSGSSFRGAPQSPNHIEPTSSLLFSPFSCLKLRPHSLSPTMIITRSAAVAAQEAEHALHREDTTKDPRSFDHHFNDLSQAGPLLVDQNQPQPQSHDHNLLRRNDAQTLYGNCFKGSCYCTCECKCQTTRQQQQQPHPSSASPLETGMMSVPKLTPASAPTTTTLLSISAQKQLEARHGPRAASASAAVLGSSPLSDTGAEGLEQHPESKPPMGGTLSRHALQRTRTTDMLLSPTLTLARPSSVVLPPLPPITLKPPPVCSSLCPPLIKLLYADHYSIRFYH